MKNINTFTIMNCNSTLKLGFHFQINLRFGTVFKIELQFDIFELHLWIVVQLEIYGFHFQKLRFGIAL